MKKSTLRNFHVPLSEDLHRRLREEADRSRQTATALARQAIDDWLRQKRKDALHGAIAAYAAQHAGSSLDLDEDLEVSSLEHLRAQQERSE
jgi:predicted transcriptional regulator